MSKFKDLLIFILGLVLVIAGLLSFISIPVVAQQNSEFNFNILIGGGFVLIFLGGVLMYFFIKTEDKKKKKPKQKPPNDIEVV